MGRGSSGSPRSPSAGAFPFAGRHFGNPSRKAGTDRRWASAGYLRSCERHRTRSTWGIDPITFAVERDNIGNMKTILKKSMSAVAFAGLLATAGVACAQSSTTTTSTTQSAGTVSSIDPNAISIQSTTSVAPTSYSYSKTTTYVDQDGNPVSVETVKSGLPVTVYYTRVGDRMTASKVVVQRTSAPVDAGATIETRKSTTTTTAPTP